jgi:hypothetical protein
LCGAGKTWLADRIVAASKFDEGFLNDPGQHAALVSALRSGQDCVVIEIAYCQEVARQAIVSELATEVPGAIVRWLCIENDLFRANKNCHERTNKGDAAGHVGINSRVSPVYTYPEGSEILRMWTKDSC